MNLAVVNSLKQTQLGNFQDEAYTPKREREAHKAGTGLSKTRDIACNSSLEPFQGDSGWTKFTFFSAISPLPILSATGFFLHFHIHRDVKEINFSSGEERKM